MPYKDHEKRRAVVREAARRTRTGDRKPTRKPLPELSELRYQTARDVLALLNEQVAAVEGDDKTGTLEKARCIGYLASLLLRAIETGDFAERLAALEKLIEERDKHQCASG